MILKQDILSGVGDYRYDVKIAQNEDEVYQAKTLRYRVFGDELKRNFDFDGKLDQDEYDEQYHHLVVFDKKNNEAVGTYRLQTYPQAVNGYGFKTEERFKLDQLPDPILKKSFEVGRVCVLSDHRNGRVLYLLWMGLAEYLKHFNCTHLFGYLALHTEHPAVAMNSYNYFKENGHLHEEISIDVQPGFECHTHPKYNESKDEVDVPPLFRNYLKVGCKICSLPSCCRKTKLIHFFILLDVNTVPDQYKKIFGV
ncbi:MAG: GNAT family N-acetyltransferase [Bacteroidetes bacterium]|nr:GNAT family N-acetyltransferase [Bacteroidota bacterium]